MTRRYGRRTKMNDCRVAPLVAILLLACCYARPVYCQVNDHIFPAAPAAKAFIDFDSSGFLLNGKRTFLVSAGMEYARVPRALWKDRLLRLQRAGFNCIEIYTFWNFHEAQEGKFNFSGDHDLDYFLKLVKQMGMYAIVRVGPYYCAEWNFGGYPIWLRFKNGVRVREGNPPFEKYADRFFDHLLPIVCSNQVNHGGAVIMVQLENEHNDAWGTVMPNGYFRHLRNKALSLGLQVPYFFSGLHHGSDPAGDGLLDDSTRPNPWFSTEFWSVWYSAYGSDSSDAATYERRTWKIIAHGGGGYNYYMAHGGTNFGYTNNDEDAASYDYGAAVGQAGDLRPIYYSFKRAAWFARSFADILENSKDATATYRYLSGEPGYSATARHSPAGDIIFFDNLQRKPVTIQPVEDFNFRFPDRIPLVLAPGEILPVVSRFLLNDEITLEWAPVRILGIARQANTTTLVIYGAPGSPAELLFRTKQKAVATGGKTSLAVTEKKVQLHTTFTSNNIPLICSFMVGRQKLRVLYMNKQLADRTWFTTAAGKEYIICGPAYAGALTIQNGQPLIHTERPLQSTADYPVWLYDADTARQLYKGKTASAGNTMLSLQPWQMKNAATETDPAYNDISWKHSVNPLPMGADGDTSAYAWYRTNINVPAAGNYTLQVDGGDRETAFVDGKKAGADTAREGEILLPLAAGKHTLAVFTAHDGRDKLAGYMGPVDSVDNKGLFGATVIVKGGPYKGTLNNWQFLVAQHREDVNRGMPAISDTGWKAYTIGQDAFGTKQGFGWFRTSIPPPPAGTAQIILSFRSVDENARVFINGKELAYHEGWNRPFAVTINRADTIRETLILTVFIENYSNEGGIDRPVRVNYTGNSTPVKGWRMRGGPGNFQQEGGWKALDGSSAGNGKPCFFRSYFIAPAPTAAGPHIIHRVLPTGLSRGFVWINGHNLGRYPEKIPVNGLYIPECWINAGKNTLVVYDEEGRQPGPVSIQPEAAVSRQLETWSTNQP